MKEANRRLFDAIEQGDLKGTIKALKDGADVNARHPGWEAPPEFPGLDVPLNQVDSIAMNSTPLHVAAYCSGSAALLGPLLRYKAKVNAKNDRGETPLHLAAMRDHSATAAELLRHHADPNAVDERGDTPLHIAAKQSNTSVARVLIEQGANLHAKNARGWTPLDCVPEDMIMVLNGDPRATVELIEGAMQDEKAKDYARRVLKDRKKRGRPGGPEVG